MAEKTLPKRGLGRGLSALMADLGSDLATGLAKEPEAPPPRADRLRPLIDLWQAYAGGGPVPDLSTMPSP